MGLFTKKEKKPREIKETDSTLVKLWYNPRTHAMMVLGAYFVFFAAVILFLKSLPTEPVKKKNENGSSIKELFVRDEDKMSTYSAIVKTSNDNYLVNGDRYAEGALNATLIDKDDLLFVVIQDGKCSVHELDKSGKKYVESNKLCPEDIKYVYFDLSYIYSLIEEKEFKDVNNEYYEIEVSDTLNIKVYYSVINKVKELRKIIINDNEDEYELSVYYAVESQQADPTNN